MIIEKWGDTGGGWEGNMGRIWKSGLHTTGDYPKSLMGQQHSWILNPTVGLHCRSEVCGCVYMRC